MTDVYTAPSAWAHGADPAYEAMSRAIVSASPVPLAARTVLDLGAGTGATSRAIAAAGGHTIAVDLSHPMLAFERLSRPPAVVADITCLPFATGSVDGAVAAFSLSHVDQPGGVLAECCRVVRPGSPVLAGVFATTGVRHPAAASIEEVTQQRGWKAPPWYLRLKNELEPLVADAGALLRLAAAARLDEVTVVDVEIDTGVDSAAALVAWRLAGPAFAGWVAALPESDRKSLVDEATAAVGTDPQPLLLTVRILSSIAPAAR